MSLLQKKRTIFIAFDYLLHDYYKCTRSLTIRLIYLSLKTYLNIFRSLKRRLKKYIDVLSRGGGRHIFTVSTYPFLKSRPRIRMEGGKIVPIMEVQYHGNPISEDGLLVTYDWGGNIGYVIDSLTGF